MPTCFNAASGTAQRTIAGQSETIGARFAAERASALPLPQRSFEAAVSEVRQVDKYQTVAWEKNRYSVPRRHAFATVTVKAYVDRVEVIRDGVRIAQHERSYGQGEQVLDPLHYLSTLGVKPAYLDHTDVYRNWRLPAAFTQLRERFETRHGSLPGARHFIRVLQLLAEHPLTRVEQAIQACRGDGVVTAERIAARCERLALRSTPGELMNPSGQLRLIPTVQVPLPDLRRFDSLLSHGGEDHGPERNAPVLRSNLKALRLPTMLAEYGKLAGEATDSNQDYLDYLLRLTELELATRSANALAGAH